MADTHDMYMRRIRNTDWTFGKETATSAALSIDSQERALLADALDAEGIAYQRIKRNDHQVSIQIKGDAVAEMASKMGAFSAKNLDYIKQSKADFQSQQGILFAAKLEEMHGTLLKNALENVGYTPQFTHNYATGEVSIFLNNEKDTEKLSNLFEAQRKETVQKISKLSWTHQPNIQMKCAEIEPEQASDIINALQQENIRADARSATTQDSTKIIVITVSGRDLAKLDALLASNQGQSQSYSHVQNLPPKQQGQGYSGRG